MSKVSYTPLSFNEFIAFIRHFKQVESVEDDLLFNAYLELIELLRIHHETFENIPYQPLDHARLILYLIYDYEFRLNGVPLEGRIKALDDESFFNKLVTAVVDKYGSESYFKFEESRLVNRFSTEISTIQVYVNFISLKLTQLPETSESERLYLDLLRSAFSICRTISELLVAGFEKEALSTWRSLHEVEATLVLVEDRALLEHYGRHVFYNAAFSGFLSKGRADEVFVEIKEKMKQHNLKSKDTRRFIEYGWIAAHPAFDDNVHKFNFRDGVETLANLSDSREAYKTASEAAHSSPLLLFVDPISFLKLTLVQLYKSFLIIETLFAAFYAQNAPETELNFYNEVRDFYLDDIKLVLSRII